MIKSSVEKMAYPIGQDIGLSDDVTQAELLNGFFKSLGSSMQKHHLEMQLCCIVDKLNANSKELILELAEFVKLEKQPK